MNTPDNIESLIIDLLNNELDKHTALQVKSIIKQDRRSNELYKLYKLLCEGLDAQFLSHAPPNMQNKFAEWLKNQPSGKIHTKWYRHYHWANKAAITVIILGFGFLVGLNIKNQQVIQEYASQLDDVQSQLLHSLEEESVGSRVQAVNMSHELANQDQKVKHALIKTMHFDPSSIVRLATVKVLSEYGPDDSILEAMQYAIQNENDPAVQVAIINYITHFESKDNIKDLDNIIADHNTIQFVKDEARSAKQKLMDK